MNRFLKGAGLLFLGFLMLLWFGYSLMNPPTRPSETYALDWVMIFARLIGAVAFIIGGILAFFAKK